jgi:hypothetical protein
VSELSVCTCPGFANYQHRGTKTDLVLVQLVAGRRRDGRGTGVEFPVKTLLTFFAFA